MVDKKPTPRPGSSGNQPAPGKTIRAKCPTCGSEEADDYAIINNDKNMHGLVFDRIMVICRNCNRFYSVYVDGHAEIESLKCKHWG